MDSAPAILEAIGQDLVLIAPPNPVDVLSVRIYIVGYFVCMLGLAILDDVFSMPVRVGLAALGLLMGYMHGYAAVHNPREPTRFVFHPDGRLAVSTLSGKELRNAPINRSRITLRRQKSAGPAQLEWSWALAKVRVSLTSEDFERLERLGIPSLKEAPVHVRTRFTRSDKRIFWIWAAIWSMPWWGVLYRGVAALWSAR